MLSFIHRINRTKHTTDSTEFHFRNTVFQKISFKSLYITLLFTQYNLSICESMIPRYNKQLFHVYKLLFCIGR